MNSKERVISAINFENPDRLPIIHAPLPIALIKYGDEIINIMKRFPQDFGPSEFRIPKHNDLAFNYRSGINKDEWGTVWEGRFEGLVGQVKETPISDWEKIESYKFPSLYDETQIKVGKNNVIKAKEDGLFVLLGYSPGNLFERMQWLRGYRKLLIDFVKLPKELNQLADMIVDYSISSIRQGLDMGADGISFADDWGTQNALMIKPSFWREFFKPRYKKMFDVVHEGGAYVFFHSDGYIMDIIDDFVEIGVDVLNPQFSCHDLEKLALKTRGKLCISTDIDRQYILPFGTISKVTHYVSRVIKLFGSENNGGMICRGEASADTKIDNIRVMYETFDKNYKIV